MLVTGVAGGGGTGTGVGVGTGAGAGIAAATVTSDTSPETVRAGVTENTMPT